MDNLRRSEEDLAVDAILFLELRKCIVQDLDQHSANFRLIWPHYDPKPETINQIRLNLHTQIETLAEMLRVPPLPFGERLYKCTEKRHNAIVKCLKAVINLTGLDGSARECDMALNIISQRIGGFRIIGVCDETADEMDRQARELWDQCGAGKKYGSMAPMTYFKVDEFNHIIPGMYFTDIFCTCPWCRG